MIAVVGVVDAMELAFDEYELELEQEGRCSHEMSVCKHGWEE